MKRFLLFISVMSLLVMIGCSKKETVTTEETKSQTPVEIEETTEIGIAEAKQIVENVYRKLVETVYTTGEENQWGYQSEPDLTILKSKTDTYTTVNLFDSFIKPNKDLLYCECDTLVFPSPVYDSRFEITENNTDKFTVYMIEPMDVIGHSGKHIYFTLVKENEQWKMDQIKIENHYSSGLNLTWEEVVPILKNLYSDEIELAEEKMLETVVGFDGENKEIIETVKTYLFKVKNDSVTKGIYSNSGSIIHDISSLEATSKPANTISTEPTDENSEPSNQPKEKEKTPAENANQNASTKEEFLAKLDAIKNQEQYSDSGVTVDLLEDNGHNLKLWDDALNEIYGVLKTQLSQSAMNDLRTEQRQWIVDRDAAAQKRSDEEGGGSYSSVVYGETLTLVTKERCYELVNQYMK